MSGRVTVILLTGPPGVGKTTLVRKICEELSKKHSINCRGFYTEEVRSDGASKSARVGFDVVSLEGKRGILARETSCGLERCQGAAPRIGKYNVYVSSFEEVALPLLAAEKDGGGGYLLVLDEVGKMELLSERFSDAVNELINGRALILATIPLQTRAALPSTIERLKSVKKSRIFQITKANRNEIQNEIVQSIAKMWGAK